MIPVVTCPNRSLDKVVIEQLPRDPCDIDVFNAACSRWIRRNLIVVVLTLATVVACFGAVIPFRDPICAFYTQRFGLPAAEIMMGLTPWPALLVMFAGMVWVHRGAKRVPELNCPHCGKCLVGMRHLVVATKNCPYCGVRVLNDPRPMPE